LTSIKGEISSKNKKKLRLEMGNRMAEGNKRRRCLDVEFKGAGGKKVYRS